MQHTQAVKQEPLTIESLDKNIREFFSKSKILKKDIALLPKEDLCCERETD